MHTTTVHTTTVHTDVSPSHSPIVGLRRVGHDGLLLEARSHHDVPAIAAAVRAHLESAQDSWHATEVVPAARTVLLVGLSEDVDAVARDIGTWTILALPAGAGPLVTLPVVFDGPDIAQVAAHWGTTADAVVARVRATEFRVGFSGFAPGFAYLTGLPDELSVPRRENPRTRVPAGSVALAGRYCGIYPRQSPGGWQLVGRVASEKAAETMLWDENREPPALLTPGTRVRFTHE